MSENLSILIPAAGASTRLGQAKQVIQFKGSTLLQRAVDCANAVDAIELIVVTGAHQEIITNSVTDASVQWLYNPDWQQGMGTSIAAGVSALDSASDGVLIFLCDQWALKADDLQLMVDSWHSDPGRIVTAISGGQTMPPVIFPSRWYQQLKQLSGEQGARYIIRQHPSMLTTVEMDNASFDLDTREQLRALQQVNQGGDQS